MKNKKFLILLTTTALIIAGCVLDVYLLNKPEKKSVAKNTTKKTEQPDKNKSSNSDTTDSENTSSNKSSADNPTTGHKMTMAEFAKKYPVGSKIKGADGTYTIDDYDNGEVYYYAPDGTYCCSKDTLENLMGGPSKEQKQAEKDYKAGKYPTDEYYQQRALDKYREVTKAYIDGKIDRVPQNTDYDGDPTGVDDNNIIIRYTTKGYPCIVFEGMIIYDEMVMPDGCAEFSGSAQPLMKWCDDRGIADYYSLSYKQLQQIFGKLDKNSKSMTINEWSKSIR